MSVTHAPQPLRRRHSQATVWSAMLIEPVTLTLAGRQFGSSPQRGLRQYHVARCPSCATQMMRGPGPNRTDVVTLDAVLLALEKIGPRYVASVEFSGMIRESSERGAAPFKEVWMLTCSEDEMRDWRLARQQALL